MQPWVSCQVQCTVRSTTLNIPIPAVFASLASLLPRSSRVFLSFSFPLVVLRFSLSASSSPGFPSAERTCVHAYTRVYARIHEDRSLSTPLSLFLSLFSPSVPPPRDRYLFLRAAVVGHPKVRGTI